MTDLERHSYNQFEGTCKEQSGFSNIIPRGGRIWIINYSVRASFVFRWFFVNVLVS